MGFFYLGVIVEVLEVGFSLLMRLSIFLLYGLMVLWIIFDGMVLYVYCDDRLVVWFL